MVAGINIALHDVQDEKSWSPDDGRDNVSAHEAFGVNSDARLPAGTTLFHALEAFWRQE